MVLEPMPGVSRARTDPRTWPWWGQVLALYTVTRLFTAAVFVWVARLQLPNLWTPGHPSYWKFVGLMFDGSWYRQIAEQGYPATLPYGADGLVQQNAWAFFPLYPALVRAVMTVTRLPWEVAAPVVATLLGAGAVLLVYRCVVLGAPRAVAAWPALPLATVALVCVFPTSPVLQAGYTESLALLLVAGSLYLLMRRRYGAAALVVVALGFARAVALPMAVVVAVHALVRWRDARRGNEAFPLRDVLRVAALGAVAVVSGFAWPLIAGWITGVPNGYLLTQESWRGVRTTTPFYGWTYVPQFWFGPWAALVVVAGFGLTIAVLVAPAAWRLGNELHTWSAAYIGYIVAVIEPGSSLARFLLLAFPMGAVTAGLVTRPERARRIAFWAVLALMVGLQVLWIRTMWLFNPHGDWPP
ncbi:MAG: hypothetical protein B7X40_02880 [Cellulomonas sp. 14-74-6]|nr:MAG: hypothetical protein B7X40_02880 [Cellulomonas sp. 14-74-6]